MPTNKLKYKIFDIFSRQWYWNRNIYFIAIIIEGASAESFKIKCIWSSNRLQTWCTYDCTPESNDIYLWKIYNGV